MSGRLSYLADLSLHCDEAAPARVRAEFDRLEGIEAVRATVKLVASELVSNAVRHSGCEEEDMIRVRVRLSREFVEISVHDPGLSATVPQVAKRREAGGLGLVLVDHLARRWGVCERQGRLVWAELPIEH